MVQILRERAPIWCGSSGIHWSKIFNAMLEFYHHFLKGQKCVKGDCLAITGSSTSVEIVLGSIRNKKNAQVGTAILID